MKNRNKIYLLVLLIVLNTYAFAQSPNAISPFNVEKYSVIDTARYEVLYELKFLRDSTKENVILTNHLVLLVGNTYSKFFNAKYIYKNPNIEKPLRDARYNFEGAGLAATEVYKNKQEEKITVTVKLAGTDINHAHKYTEKIPIHHWQLLNKRKRILGYDCQSAKLSYLGRTYTAWFAPTIPLNEGPWKFWGLPGLILEVADTRDNYVFRTIGIKKLSTPKEIVSYTTNYTITTREKLNKHIKNLHKNYVKVLESMGNDIVFVDSKGKIVKSNNISYPYNPIELE